MTASPEARFHAFLQPAAPRRGRCRPAAAPLPSELCRGGVAAGGAVVGTGGAPTGVLLPKRGTFHVSRDKLFARILHMKYFDYVG